MVEGECAMKVEGSGVDSVRVSNGGTCGPIFKLGM